MNKEYKKAMEMDAKDSLSKYKNQFVCDDNLIYLDGNSLGKLPVKTIQIQQDVLTEQWGNRLIRAWNDGWVDLSSKTAEKIATLVGAQADEIFVGDTTSIHLYKLAFAALSAQKERTTILTDDLNFPSDFYVLQGLIKSHFPGHILKVIPSDGIQMPVTSIKQALNEQTSLLTLSHVTYKSAFLYPMATINEMANRSGCLVLWDLSHSVGAVPIDLNNSNTDLAVGCTYKYLNGGPGAPAFLYVKKDLQKALQNPIWSWFSHIRPFDFQNEYIPNPTIEKFAISTPSILSLAAIGPGVDMLLEAGMHTIRRKSMEQSEFLIHLIKKHLIPLGFDLASPKEVSHRGSHISISHDDAYRINRAMIAPVGSQKTIIPDFRPPNNIRLGITPLYTSFKDLYDAVIRIREIVETKEFKAFSSVPSRVP